MTERVSKRRPKALGKPAPPPVKTNRRVRPKTPSAEEAAREIAEPKPTLKERLAGARGVLGRMRRGFELALRGALVIVVGVGAVALGRLVERHVRTSPAFATSAIELEGHVRISREELLDIAGLALGKNVFEVAPEDAERSLSEHPWIAEAHVRRRLPGTYEVEVRERRAVALLVLGEVFLVADDGAVFKPVEEGDPIDLPVITGIERERFLRDRGFRTSVVLEAVALLHDYRGAGLWTSEPIGELHVERDDGLSLYLGDDATYVRLGHGPFRPKLTRLRTVLDELGQRGARAEYVYLDNERRPDRVTVRVREPEVLSVAPPAPAQDG